MKLTEAFIIKEADEDQGLTDPALTKLYGQQKGGWVMLQPKDKLKLAGGVEMIKGRKSMTPFPAPQDVLGRAEVPDINAAIDRVPHMRVHDQIRSMWQSLKGDQGLKIDMDEKDPTKTVQVVNRMD